MKNKTFFKINIIYYVAMVLVAVIFLLGYLGILQNEILSTLLIQVVVMFAVPLLMYTLMISKNVKSTFADFGFKSISGKMVLISIGLGVVLYFINVFVSDAFSGIITLFGYETIGSGQTITVDYGFLLKEFIFSAIFPGIFEEFLHRGMLIHAGKKCGNLRFCLIISSILFGLMHMSITKFFYTAILGFLMGYVAIISDSIYPTMIIHFMNNALASYFFYGTHLNLPLATFVRDFEIVLSSNILLFIIVMVIFVLLMIQLYILLTRAMVREQAKRDVKKIIDYLKLNDLPIEEAQIKVNQANEIINASENSTLSTNVPSGVKFKFFDKIFLYSSLVLGGLVTIISFISGVI